MDEKILIIIPAYNEEESILSTYQSIIDFNKKNNTNLDVIVINDGSRDNTYKICIDNNIPTISLIHNLGIGGAVQTGYKYAEMNDYDIAIQFDGDGQHDINSVQNLINSILNKNNDFVIGSRFVHGSKSEFKSSRARRMGIRLISFMIKLVTGKRIMDTTSGYRAANKKVISLFAYSYPVEYPEPITTTELIKMGYVIDEVPAMMFEREGGVSSIHSWKNFYYMFNILLSILIIGTGRYNK
ncbi:MULTISPECIES: glycosyltransferase family 2 protein [unclassified Breznakia]|uniref:glycosyltransferase family 2 protein n=1 Tax=unclassified Breznakia TaxID=2623764 RepID=UPI00247726AF|nr:MULTISPECIES: glycosyltransferase family 2 protein [unclassified Breznakia]MDH6367897.1 glycosyltransferase involved in cell wall biosynthesis [Breznakia sp. PH1-1]MDH6404985.1 glycosyltransferase involved in cell wall biosynthesis [Breznakia sp. PF1-11]MDH6412704.1 glycosyltransferase involved in cell wall biosynthesis [Breznakia sp. PFB1-11]MDH6415060.1 glycosyltransferase involved in cell wall biosynthesis [Breznakia sp. PFB1-14]MDH6417371.1 glycosyltransferase involved in cell wall bios